MKKLNYVYAVMTQKVSNVAESLLIPLLYTKKDNLTTEINIKYDSTKHSVCDFYYKQNQEKKPVIIYIHGGGFICGTKRLRKYYCYEYAKNGFFVMNTHYDYAPQKKFPHQIKQLFKAVEFLFQNADKYNLDLSRITLAGESAGAYFCVYLAAIAKDKSLYDKLKIDFNYKESFDVRSTILLNGACNHLRLAKNNFLNMGTFLYSFFDMDKKELLQKENDPECHYFSPIRFINKDFPPSVIVEGSKDPLAPESRDFCELLNKLVIKNIHLKANGLIGIHGFCIAAKTKEGKRLFEKSLQFIEKTSEK